MNRDMRPQYHNDPRNERDPSNEVDIPPDAFYIFLDDDGDLLAPKMPVKNPDVTIDNPWDNPYQQGLKFEKSIVYPKLSLADLRQKAQAAGRGGPNTILAIGSELDYFGNGEPWRERPLSEFKSDADVLQWVEKSVDDMFDAYLGDETNWKDKEPYNPYDASEGTPTLEELMTTLEQAGFDKYASEIKDVLAQLPPLKRRPLLPGAPRKTRQQPQIGSPMLQKGEQYTDVNPQTGAEMTKNYHPHAKGVLVSDWLRKQVQGEPDPAKKDFLKEILDKALVAEVSPSDGMREAGEGGAHWLSQPHDARPPRKGDAVESFLVAELTQASDKRKRDVIQELLDKRKSSKGVTPRAASESMVKCANELRERGYTALALRLEEKSAAIYRQGASIRIKSLPEYIETKKSKSLPDDKNLYDEMYDKYIRVFEGAAALLKTAKAGMHDPSDLEEALKEVLVANQLMMQKLLEVGATEKGVRS